MVSITHCYGYHIQNQKEYFRISVNYNSQKEWYAEIDAASLNKEKLAMLLRVLSETIAEDTEI